MCLFQFSLMTESLHSFRILFIFQAENNVRQSAEFVNKVSRTLVKLKM